MKDDSGWCIGRKWSWFILKHPSNIFLDRMKNTQTVCPEQRLKYWSCQYVAGIFQGVSSTFCGPWTLCPPFFHIYTCISFIFWCPQVYQHFDLFFSFWIQRFHHVLFFWRHSASIFWTRRNGSAGALGLTGSEEKVGSCQNKMPALYISFIFISHNGFYIMKTVWW
jgi:hypothetical protein